MEVNIVPRQVQGRRAVWYLRNGVTIHGTFSKARGKTARKNQLPLIQITFLHCDQLQRVVYVVLFDADLCPGAECRKWGFLWLLAISVHENDCKPLPPQCRLVNTFVYRQHLHVLHLKMFLGVQPIPGALWKGSITWQAPERTESWDWLQGSICVH